MKDPDNINRRYQDLQAYVGWTDDDAERVRSVSAKLTRRLPALVEDFYAEIARHSEAHKVFTGGQAQIDRLKATLWRGSATCSTGRMIGPTFCVAGRSGAAC